MYLNGRHVCAERNLVLELDGEFGHALQHLRLVVALHWNVHVIFQVAVVLGRRRRVVDGSDVQQAFDEIELLAESRTQVGRCKCQGY